MKNKKTQKGQALITFIIIMSVAAMMVSSMSVVSIIGSQATLDTYLGEKCFRLAQSGIEDASLQLLRNPNYSGEVMTIGKGTVTIVVSGTNNKIITSKAVLGGFTKTIEISGIITNGVFTQTSWREI